MKTVLYKTAAESGQCKKLLSGSGLGGSSANKGRDYKVTPSLKMDISS